MEYIERYWRDATPADAIKEPPMVARFRDEESEDWFIDELVGFDRSKTYKWCGETRDTINCQVYDAPDPGEGWRLIDVKKETPKEGDQYLVYPSQWIDRGDCYGCFKDDKFYRRRIEQPKPKPTYIPFTWEDREQLRGRWIVDGDGDEHCIVRLELYQEIFSINGASAEDALEDWHFLDTGKPFGKKVV